MKKLRKKAEENTSVIKRANREDTIVKESTPLDHSVKHLNGKQVGLSVGVTKNMDNYESLRIDVWLTDTVNEDETEKEAYERVFGVVDDVLQNAVEYYTQ